MKTFSTAIFMGAATVFAAIRVPAQTSFSISEHTIANGGLTISRAGDFALSGTIGQPAPRVLRGGSFTLGGGFWGVAMVLQQAGLPRLTIARSAQRVTLAWSHTEDDADVLLETSLTLSDKAVWSTVAAQRETTADAIQVSVPATPGQRYFRLRRREPFP